MIAYVSSNSRLKTRSKKRLAISSSSWIMSPKMRFDRNASIEIKGFGKDDFSDFELDLEIVSLTC
jgi:hypothetical protein